MTSSGRGLAFAQCSRSPSAVRLLAAGRSQLDPPDLRPHAMPFQSIEPRRLYRQIADQIRDADPRRANSPPGARLPPERDLAKQLGVSRPSVREALIALEVEGLRRGAHRIRASTCQRAERRHRGGDEAARGRGRALRAAAARYVDRERMRGARRRSRRRRRRSRRSRTRSTRCSAKSTTASISRWPAIGSSIMRIAEATGNGALVAVVKMLWEERTGPLYKQLEHHYDSPALWSSGDGRAPRGVQGDRRAATRGGARAAMQRHLNQAYKRILDGLGHAALTRASVSRGGSTMLACRIHAKEDLRIEPADMPDAGPGEVLLRLGARRHLRLGSALLLRGPQRQLRRARAADPGARGVRAWSPRVGAGVTRVKVGDKVAVSPVARMRPLRLLPRGPRAAVREHALPRQREPASRTCRACSASTS